MHTSPSLEQPLCAPILHSTFLMRCRSATTAAQSLWVSDSLLSEAFHRFVRVSQAEKQHRRHGSNIPGPLEARRRLARRRMGMTTLGTGSGVAPTDGEVGVLFGFGNLRGPPIGSEFEKGWKYQAPGAAAILPGVKKAKKESASGRYWPFVGSDGLPWEFEQERQPTEKERRLDEFLRMPEEPSEDTRANFDVLLEPLHSQEKVSVSDLEPILNFFRWTTDAPSGHHIIQLIDSLSSKEVTRGTWEALTALIGQKAAHNKVASKELTLMFQLILNRTREWQFPSTRLANHIAATTKSEVLVDVLEYIVTSPEHRVKTKKWLYNIHVLYHSTPKSRIRSRSWKRICTLLAKHFQPSEPLVNKHFANMRRSEFARVLLRFYVQSWVAEAEELLHNKEGQVLDYGDIKHFSFSDTVHNANSARTVSDPVHQTATPVRYTNVHYIDLLARRFRAGDHYALVELVSYLALHKIPYQRLLDEIFEVYMQTQTNKKTKNLYLKLRERDNVGISTALAGKLVHHFMAAGEYDFAFYAFRKTPTLPLLPFLELPLKLIEQGTTHGAYIFELLNRFNASDRLPPSERRHQRLAIKDEHIDLVHKCAYAFATSEHLRPRTAFRRVWECYRFLRLRQAPIKPLLSRAMVKAGISRPLKESERLSQTQVKYVINVVNKVEGPNVAKELDRLTWEFWGRTLNRQWKQRRRPPAKGPEDQEEWREKGQLWTMSGGRRLRPRLGVDDSLVEVEERDQEGSALTEDEMSMESSTNTQPESDMSLRSESSLDEMNEVLSSLHTAPQRTIPAEAPEPANYAPFAENDTGEEERSLQFISFDPRPSTEYIKDHPKAETVIDVHETASATPSDLARDIHPPEEYRSFSKVGRDQDPPTTEPSRSTSLPSEHLNPNSDVSEQLSPGPKLRYIEQTKHLKQFRPLDQSDSLSHKHLSMLSDDEAVQPIRRLRLDRASSQPESLEELRNDSADVAEDSSGAHREVQVRSIWSKRSGNGARGWLDLLSSNAILPPEKRVEKGASLARKQTM